jgi:hypothetical protein
MEIDMPIASCIHVFFCLKEEIISNFSYVFSLERGISNFSDEVVCKEALLNRIT